MQKNPFVVFLIGLSVVISGCLGGGNDSADDGTNKAPIAQIEPVLPNPAYVGQTITFSASGSDEDGFVVGYLWGSSIDGEISTDRQFSTNTLSVGEHTIYLKVIDDEGKWSSKDDLVLAILPENHAPMGDIGVSEESIYAGEQVNFSAEYISDSDDDELSYNWDFGDGNTSNDIKTQHHYSKPGTYNVFLTVSDGKNFNGTSTFMQSIYIILNFEWNDPITEVENCENCADSDANHQHTNLIQHFLQTDNITLIDYHNLNCDGNVKPPAELDNTAGRPCYPEFKNAAPTPGDNTEIAIEGNFLEDCEKNDGGGGCFAYVAAYNQFHILDISKPNNITLLSTYYAEVARIMDIKVTRDNNWVLINHELTNSELDPIPNDDDANSGMNRLDLIDVSDKSYPVKRAEWNNPPAGFRNQDVHVYCETLTSDYEKMPGSDSDCDLFLFSADPYPEINGAGLYKGTQVFYAMNVFDPLAGENESKEFARWGGYSPDSDTTCGGTMFSSDNVIHKHPITNQILLYVSYWDAGLRILDVSNPPPVPDPNGLSWPQNNEVGRWLGCPTDSSGWYGPGGGGHAGMSAEEWTSKLDGNGWINYAVPYDHLICNGISEYVDESEWPTSCGTGPDDPTYGVNWRHYTLIAPEYGQNDNHTGYVRTIDTTDPTKPFLVSEWKLPGKGVREDGSEHENHYIPNIYIYSPHNGDTGTNGNVYWTHHHAGTWITGHDRIWETITWKDNIVSPDQGWQAIEQLGTTDTLGYYLPHGPDWMDNAIEELGYDMADCWASCMIPFSLGLQFDPRGYIYISDMISGVYVIQYEGDKQSDYLFSRES